MSAAKMLRDAADYIAEHGFNKGGYGSPDGSVCALGACRAVVTGDPYQVPVSDDYWYADASLHAAVLDQADDITEWNDAPGRTADEVITLLRSVADDLDREAAS